jgi:hypothetical protein
LVIEIFAVRFVPQAGMGERFRQEQRIAKLVADTFFQRVHATKR